MGNNYYRGFVYTRNPIDGKNELYGKISNNYEFNYIEDNCFEESFESILKKTIPDIYEEFYNICKKIEQYFKDMQYIEFEILNDKIYIVSCECGKRTVQAASKIAFDLMGKVIIRENNSIFYNIDVIREYSNFTDKNKSFKEKTGYKRYTKSLIKRDNKKIR